MVSQTLNNNDSVDQCNNTIKLNKSKFVNTILNKCKKNLINDNGTCEATIKKEVTDDDGNVVDNVCDDNSDEEYEEEIHIIGEDEEFIDENGDYEIVEVDEDDLIQEQCVLMPYRDKISTRPIIKIEKNFDFDEKRLFVPESKCLQTLHERFSELQSKLLKYTINPIFSIGGLSNNLNFDNTNCQTNSHQPHRRSAFTRLGYFFKKPTSNKAQQLAANKLKRKSMKFFSSTKSNVENQHDYWRQKFKWHDREPKSKEELDEEIDDYMAKKGQINLSDDEDEENNNFNHRNKSSLNESLLTKALDEELEQYMNKVTSKTKLDDDLEKYMSKRVINNNNNNVKVENQNELNCESINSISLNDSNLLDTIDETHETTMMDVDFP